MKKNEMNSSIQEAISSRLHSCQKPLILSHIRPDGDAIGSLIALGLALKNAGKEPQLVLEDGLPAKYRFIIGSEIVSSKIERDNDLIITVDCSDLHRLGDIAKELTVDINIDHHITNSNFGAVNLIQPEAPATSEILAEHLSDWGFNVDRDIASALLMGILTDTIGFRTSNVRPETLRQAANLMEIGADLSEIYLRSLVSQSFPASLLWGRALNRLVKENGLVWTVITLEDRKEAKYTGRDDADLTNVLSSIEGSDVAILFNEQKDDKVKVSWRSNPPYDVSWVAQQFGGGGHPPAAGADMDGSLEEVEAEVLKFTKQYMKDIHSKGD
jgi:phosphoesterase RecJ-like protein